MSIPSIPSTTPFHPRSKTSSSNPNPKTMESEATATYPVAVGGDDPLFTFTTGSPLDIETLFAQIPVDCTTMEDYLLLDESAGDTSLCTIAVADVADVNAAAGLRQAVLFPVGLAGSTAATTGAENLRPEQNGHPWFGCPESETGAGLITQPATYSVVGNPGPFTATGMAERTPPSGSAPPLGFDLTPTAAAVKDSILSVECPPLEPTPVVVNYAGLAMLELGPYSPTFDMGIISSPDLELNARAGLPQSAGGGGGCDCDALTEAAPVRGSCKRKKLVCGGSASQRSMPETNLVDVELEAGLVVQSSDPSSADITIKLPTTGSTDREIFRFLRREETSSMPHGKDPEVNRGVAEEDQTGPKAARSYVTTIRMMPDQYTHLGYWKEKEVETMRDEEEISALSPLCAMYFGLKKTFQFHTSDGNRTNWFMHEYIPLGRWGSIDWYMEGLRFRVLDYKEARVPAYPVPRPPHVKIKNKIVALKHRKRETHDRWVTGESEAWQDFIKIYDRHPELQGSKLVYAVCCHCEGVLKAGTDNGTKSLLTHRDRTCPIKNKKQQPRPSRE